MLQLEYRASRCCFAAHEGMAGRLAKMGCMRSRGIALLMTLAVGAILTGLAASLLALYFQDFSWQRSQQSALQAYWNARSGVERYSDERRLPTDGRYDFGVCGDCSVEESKGDLVFAGHCRGAQRKIRLLGGNPARRQEE